MRRHGYSIGLAILALALGACSVEETTAPPLAGPSEFALGIVVHATPDSITQDGASQSLVTIDAKGPDGQPARNVPLRLAMHVNDVIQDFGTLSTKSTVTDFNGSARVTYTAPRSPLESTGSGTVVTIVVTPSGSDYRGEHDRVVDIRLVPPGVVVPPNSPPQAAFTFAPTTVTAFTNVAFDASSSTDEGVPCAGRCVYEWDFGDGGRGSGIIVTHEFREVGTFLVRLTVTDAGGKSGTSTQSIVVGAAQAPIADFAFSPSTPTPNQTVFFNASPSRAAPGRTIVSYAWDLGTGETASGVTVSKAYSAVGTYSVTLNVTDDAGQVGTATKTVPVAIPTPTAMTTKVP